MADLVYLWLLVAGRSLMHTILTSLERIAFNGDQLQFLLVETTYQPFISLFHQIGAIKDHPELAAIRLFPLCYAVFQTANSLP